MSKQLFRAIEEENLPALRQILENDQDAVRASKVLAEAPSKTLGRKVVSPLEWAILRRSVGSVEALLASAPLAEHGRDPEAPVHLLLEVLGDDWAENHLPDRDRYPTPRDALPPPGDRTPAESLRAVGQIVALMDQAGVDWSRPHGQNKRLRIEHLNLHEASPAYPMLNPIVQRVRAELQLGRRAPRRRMSP